MLFSHTKVNLNTTGGAIAKIKEEKPDMSDGESQLVLKVIYKCIICNTQYNNQHSYAAHMTKHSEPVPKGQTEFRYVYYYNHDRIIFSMFQKLLFFAF